MSCLSPKAQSACSVVLERRRRRSFPSSNCPFSFSLWTLPILYLVFLVYFLPSWSPLHYSSLWSSATRHTLYQISSHSFHVWLFFFFSNGIIFSSYPCFISFFVLEVYPILVRWSSSPLQPFCCLVWCKSRTALDQTMDENRSEDESFSTEKYLLYRKKDTASPGGGCITVFFLLFMFISVYVVHDYIC